MEEKEVILTQEGFDKLEKELEYLRTEKRTEIAERIKVALGFGDLSENSEYDEAKNAQAENENKIAELENKIRHAKIIDESEIDTKTVQIGNTVKLYDLEFDEEVEYTIVGSTEVNIAENKISNESPLGKALIGAKKGSTIEVKAPDGYTLSSSEVTFEITGDESESKTVTFYNTKNQITIDKVDSDTGESLKGAKLRVTNSTNDEIVTFTTDGKPHELEK